MKFKRFSRGPFLYILLGLIALTLLTGNLRGDGEYTEVDTASVLAAIEAGDVAATEKDPVQVLANEQEIRLSL